MAALQELPPSEAGVNQLSGKSIDTSSSYAEFQQQLTKSLNEEDYMKFKVILFEQSRRYENTECFAFVCNKNYVEFKQKCYDPVVEGTFPGLRGLHS